MNKDAVLTMEPGRELDELVIEWVMGWEAVQPSVPENDFEWLDGKGKKFSAGLWNPSTDLAAAWRVVEKMRTCMPFSERVYLDIRVYPDRYQVLPHKEENNKLLNDCIVSTPSLPEAICKAALLAVLDKEASG